MGSVEAENAIAAPHLAARVAVAVVHLVVRRTLRLSEDDIESTNIMFPCSLSDPMSTDADLA